MRVIPTPTPEVTLEATPAVEKVTVTSLSLTETVSSSIVNTRTLLQMPTNDSQISPILYTARDYRRRFNSSASIISLVEQTLESNPELFSFWQKDITYYPNLRDLAGSLVAVNSSERPLLICPNLIEGGDFEQFDPNWEILASTRPPMYSNEQTFDNSLQSVRLGAGLELPNVENVSEVRHKPILLPFGATRIILRFLYYPFYDAAPGADLQQADLFDATTDQLIGSLLNIQDNARIWKARDFDLTQYAGRSISLRFRVRNDGEAGRTLMYIDNVELAYCPIILTPTPTPVTLLPWRTSTPTLILINSPQSTPSPILSQTPTSAITSLAEQTRDVLTITPNPSINQSVILLEPLGTILMGRQTFHWSTDITLGENQYFELIFWTKGSHPISSGFGLAAPSKETVVTINLDRIADILPGILQSENDYQWGVLLVELNPYRRIQYLGGGHHFRLVERELEGEPTPTPPPPP